MLSTKRSRASCAASRCKPLHHGKHTDHLQWTTACRAQCIHCMRAPVHFHNCKRLRMVCCPCRMVCEYVMRRRTSEDSEVSFQHQERAARSKSASPRPSTNFAAHALRRLQASDAEGVAPSQRLHQFQSRLGVCTVPSIRTSHTLAIRPIPCRAWP